MAPRRGASRPAVSVSSDDYSNDPESLRRRSSREVYARVAGKAHAGAWVLAGVLAFVYGGVGAAAGDPARSNAWAVWLGCGSVGAAMTVAAYCLVYLPCVARVRLPYETAAPWAVPVATGALVTALFAFIVGLWPAFGLLTPPLVFVLAMAALMSTHFIPSCGCE